MRGAPKLLESPEVWPGPEYIVMFAAANPRAQILSGSVSPRTQNVCEAHNAVQKRRGSKVLHRDGKMLFFSRSLPQAGAHHAEPDGRVEVRLHARARARKAFRNTERDIAERT